MRSALQLLAERRRAAVGLALAAETCILVALALVPPSDASGVPAAVTAGIGGTVAVVFGVLDGVAVAFVGAVVFAALGGWGAGHLAALGFWPAVVAAVGLFARRVEGLRIGMRLLVSEHERERRSTAAELHDEDAQRLTGALLSLGAGSDAAVDDARELIRETIRALRERAVDLSPRALEDYGLAPALETLAATVSQRSGMDVRVDSNWHERAPDETELALFRAAQAALADSAERGASTARVSLGRNGGTIVVEVEDDGVRNGRLTATPGRLDGLRERMRLLGGSLTVGRTPSGGTDVRAELPI